MELNTICKKCTKSYTYSPNSPLWNFEFCSKKCNRSNFKKTGLGYVPMRVKEEFDKIFKERAYITYH